MGQMKIYEARLDDEMLEIFRSAIVAVKNSSLTRLSLAQLIKQLLTQETNLVPLFFQELGIQQSLFKERLNEQIANCARFRGKGVHIDAEVRDAFRTALASARAHGRDKITVEDTMAALVQSFDGPFMTILIELGADPYVSTAKVLALLEKRRHPHRHEASPPDNTSPGFRKGEIVRITSGAFGAMSAIVEAVDREKSKLTVGVRLLGKHRAVTLNFSEVQKIEFS